MGGRNGIMRHCGAVLGITPKAQPAALNCVWARWAQALHEFVFLNVAGLSYK